MNFTWTNGRSLETVTKGDLTTSYKYNQDNLRTSKTVNGITTTYIWEDSTLIAEETSGIVTWYIYDANGSVIGFQRQESADSETFTTYYYERNLQVDIAAIYGEDGTELAGYTYSAWGEITGITGDENLAKSNPWKYRGYYYDEEIGMYYLQSRYYDAEVGRFLNADAAEMLLASTLGLKGTNLFEYCNNNPVNSNDSSGIIALFSGNGKYQFGILGGILEVLFKINDGERRASKLLTAFLNGYTKFVIARNVKLLMDKFPSLSKYPKVQVAISAITGYLGSKYFIW